jgi:hypothetical protein
MKKILKMCLSHSSAVNWSSAGENRPQPKAQVYLWVVHLKSSNSFSSYPF